MFVDEAQTSGSSDPCGSAMARGKIVHTNVSKLILLSYYLNTKYFGWVKKNNYELHQICKQPIYTILRTYSILQTSTPSEKGKY